MTEELKPDSIIVTWKDKRLEQASELIKSVAGEWNSDQEGIRGPLRLASAMVEIADYEIERLGEARAALESTQA